jgi:hypothetical protein
MLLLFAWSATLCASDYFGQVTFNGLPVQARRSPQHTVKSKAAATTDQDGIYHLNGLADGTWRPHDRDAWLHDRDARDQRACRKGSAAVRAHVRPLDEITRDVLNAQPTTAPTAFARTRLTQIAPVDRFAGSSDGAPIDLSVLIGPSGIGAADGLLINGSLNNGASTPFALPRAIGNNRPRPPSVFTYAAAMQLGNSAWDARPFSMTGSPAAKPSYTDAQGVGTMQGQLRVPWLRNMVNIAVNYQGESATNANMQSARVPTDLERAGNFSQTLDVRGLPVQLVDPATRQAFAGNMVPADRISPQAAALLAYYPRADASASGRFNYQRPVLSSTRQNSVRSRIAYTTFRQHQFNVAGAYQRIEGDTTSLFGFDDSRQASTIDAQDRGRVASVAIHDPHHSLPIHTNRDGLSPVLRQSHRRLGQRRHHGQRHRPPELGTTIADVRERSRRPLRRPLRIVNRSNARGERRRLEVSGESHRRHRRRDADTRQRSLRATGSARHVQLYRRRHRRGLR